MRIITLIGPPGAGKGTQAILLAEKLDLYHFETSKLIEQKVMSAQESEFLEIEGKKYFLVEEKKLWKEGSLCSPPFVSHITQDKIKSLAKNNTGIIFSGSPRTLYEGEKIIPLLRDLYGAENIIVINILLKAEDSIQRNSNRKICELMRHPILYNKETENINFCPLDGSRLLRREGLDDAETIKVRLKEYEKRTLPLIEYFKKENLKIIEIDGSPSPAVIFSNILKKLPLATN